MTTLVLSGSELQASISLSSPLLSAVPVFCLSAADARGGVVSPSPASDVCGAPRSLAPPLVPLLVEGTSDALLASSANVAAAPEGDISDPFASSSRDLLCAEGWEGESLASAAEEPPFMGGDLRLVGW